MNNARQDRDAKVPDEKRSGVRHTAEPLVDTGCSCGNAFHMGSMDPREHANSCPQHPDNKSRRDDQAGRERKSARPMNSVETPSYELTDGGSNETVDVGARDTRPQS